MNHTKHKKCAGPYTAMVVIGRMVMRRLLENEVAEIRAEMKKEGRYTEQALERAAELYTLTPHLGPFDEDGRCFDVGQLGRMYQWLGQRAMGLPNLAFDGEPKESVRGESVVGVEAKRTLDVADLDKDEKALKKRVRVDRLEVERMKVEEEKKAFLRGSGVNQWCRGRVKRKGM